MMFADSFLIVQNCTVILVFFQVFHVFLVFFRLFFQLFSQKTTKQTLKHRFVVVLTISALFRTPSPLRGALFVVTARPLM